MILQQVVCQSNRPNLGILCQPLCPCLQLSRLCEVDVGKSTPNNLAIVKWFSKRVINLAFLIMHPWYVYKSSRKSMYFQLVFRRVIKMFIHVV